MPELTCQELVELVTDYLEDALAASERARFDEHLAGCPPCRAHLGQMRDTIRLLGRLPAESLSEETCRDLLHAFRDWKAARP